MRATARWMIVAITICSWIALSNHCAIRALTTKAEINHTGCPFHSKPAKVPAKSASIECCKVLRALAATSTKHLAPAIVDLPNIDRDCSQIRVFAPEILFARATRDTGPPGKTAFVQLSASVRANAPPFLA